MEHNAYTVTDTGQGFLNIVDAYKGVIVSRISPRGKLVTPPMVTGNRVSFVVQKPDGSKLGTVHNLPGGSLINQFRV